MSQFKAAMERIHRPATTTSDDADEKCENEDNERTTLPPTLSLSAPVPAATGPPPHPLISKLERYAAFLLMPVLPLLWCILLLSTLDRDALLSAYAMPLLGIGSAALANAVPGESPYLLIDPYLLCNVTWCMVLRLFSLLSFLSSFPINQRLVACHSSRWRHRIYTNPIPL